MPHIEFLIQCLGPENHQELRVIAAGGLANSSDPRAVEPLRRAMTDEDHRVRGAAAKALATIACNWATAAIHVIGNDEASIGNEAVASLAQVMHTAAAALIEAMENDADPITQSHAASVLAGIPQDRSIACLRALLAHPEAGVIAAAALAARGENEAIERLRAVLLGGHESPPRRLNAMHGLLAVEDEPATHALCGILEDAATLESWADELGSEAVIRILDLAARSGRDAVRQAAMSALERLESASDPEDGESNGIERILSDLVDPSSDVRAGAGEWLLETGRELPTSVLVALVDEHFDDGTELSEVITILGGRDDPASISALIRTLRHSDWMTRSFSVRALGALGDPGSVDELCRVLREDPQQLVRRHAADALAQVGETRAGEALTFAVLNDAGLRQNDDRVARGAGAALGQLDYREAILGLIAAFESDREVVRRCAAWALGELKAHEAVDELIALVDTDTAARMQQAAAWALGQIKAPESGRSLLRLLERSRDPGPRREAARSLGELKDPEAVAGLISALHDDDVEVRAAAARAIGEVRDRAAVGQLVQSLAEDSEPEVRRLAAWALGNIRDHSSGPALVRSLRVESDPAVRNTAAHALGELQWQDTIAVLCGTLRNDIDAAVRRTAALALDRAGDTTAIPALEEAIRNDPAPEVREAAREALKRLRRTGE